MESWTTTAQLVSRLTYTSFILSFVEQILHRDVRLGFAQSIWLLCDRTVYSTSMSFYTRSTDQKRSDSKGENFSCYISRQESPHFEGWKLSGAWCTVGIDRLHKGSFIEISGCQMVLMRYFNGENLVNCVLYNYPRSKTSEYFSCIILYKIVSRTEYRLCIIEISWHVDKYHASYSLTKKEISLIRIEISRILFINPNFNYCFL